VESCFYNLKKCFAVFLFFSILNLLSVVFCRVLFDTWQSLCRVSEKGLGKGFAEYKIAFCRVSKTLGKERDFGSAWCDIRRASGAVYIFGL
jgi:hypothetical protein